MDFNQNSLKALEFDGTRKPIPDPKGNGLYLRINKGGKKSWYFIYRMRTQYAKPQWLRIGDFDTMKLVEARKLAVEYTNQVDRGIDPAKELKKVAPKEHTVAEAAARFMAEYAPFKLSQKTFREYKSALKIYILPKLGKIPLKELSEHLDQWHSAERKYKTTINRALATLSSIHTQAEKWGWVPRGSNPCRFVERNREIPRKREITDAELEAIGHALREVEGTYNVWALAAIKVVALCHARVSEVLSLKYDDDLHLDDGYAELRYHKTAKTAGAKRLYLPPAAVEVIRKLPRQEGSPWVFPSRQKGMALTASGLNDVWNKICKCAGVKNLRQHDFRSFAASEAVDQGIELLVASKILGHSDSRTTAKHYAQVRDRKAAEASQKISAKVVKAFGLEQDQNECKED